MLQAIKTDLHLLLECLKYQMNCPDSQKQALLTIVSVCQQNEHNMEFFKEMGGVTFIYNLSRSSHYSEVKETALFTLGSLAEFNESCKQSICREETFCDLAECMKHSMSHTQKRVAVYMVCVLVSNNSRGQSLAKASGCIDILLTLFRDSFPVSGRSNERLPLWTAVSSALCGCVNNPQNEENQSACMRMFPQVKAWLQQVPLSKAELAQPICSFIGMTVANNSHAQEYFASVGGLFTLTHALENVVPQCKDNPAACKIASMITRTLSACIADNGALVPVLSELRVVPDLLLLLSSPNLNSQDQLVVMLTLGHCTDACGECGWIDMCYVKIGKEIEQPNLLVMSLVKHQSEFMLGGGLPLMISLLTDANDEEVRKAAIFVLQTCKKITESLGGDVSGPNEMCDLQRHWQSAREILQRIQHLEKRQLVHVCDLKQWVKDMENSPPRHMQPVLLRPVECREELWEDSVVRKVKGRSRVYEEESDRENILHMHMTPTQTHTPAVTTRRAQNLEPMPHVRRQIFRDIDKPLDSSQIRQEPEERDNEKMATEESELHMRREEEMKKKAVEEMDRDEKEEMVKMKAHLGRGTDKVDWTQNPDKATCSLPPAEGDRSMQRPDIFRHPAPMKQRQQQQAPSDDDLSLCSEILDSEIERILITPVVSKPCKLRCAGCVSGVDEVNSRSVGAVLHSCRSLCEFHLALQQAEDHFKRGLQCERSKHTGKARDASLFEFTSKHISINRERRLGYTNRPNHRDAMKLINLTTLKKPCKQMGSNMEGRNVPNVQCRTLLGDGKKTSSGSHKERKNFTADELVYLTEGVKRFACLLKPLFFPLSLIRRKLKQGLAQAPDLLTMDSAEQRVH
ncbi:hypothetical protein NFI96_019829 [Prochilodus magdalenae]|nr:hypothetical protein NFI96_019829 [Prochilodus magdalenae]